MEIKTYPLRSVTIDEAMQMQFKIIDSITNNFDGYEVLSLGDLGVVPGLGKPNFTKKAEAVFARVFDAPAALLVRGSGTGALRLCFSAVLNAGDYLLVHDAPVYPTTNTTLKTMGINLIKADFNNLDCITQIINEHKAIIKGALVQHTRQKIDDSYDFCNVIGHIKSLLPDAPIITDDNYAAFKAEKIGCQAGADLSSFSCFKTLGPEGVGVIIGNAEYIQKIQKEQYSGGSQVQGHEAMAAIRGIVYAPVSLAVQAQVGEELVKLLNNGAVKNVRRAFIANAQSKVVLVEFDFNCAEALLKLTPKFGAAAHPVGSESVYEFAPMIYRISGTFREQDPELEKRMIRINPIRSGAQTIIRILNDAMAGIGGQ